MIASLRWSLSLLRTNKRLKEHDNFAERSEYVISLIFNTWIEWNCIHLTLDTSGLSGLFLQRIQTGRDNVSINYTHYLSFTERNRWVLIVYFSVGKRTSGIEGDCNFNRINHSLFLRNVRNRALRFFTAGKPWPPAIPRKVNEIVLLATLLDVFSRAFRAVIVGR